MGKHIKLVLSGVIVIMVFSLSGCSGSGSSSSAVYYSGYHNPYPGWGYYGRRTVYVDHRPGYRPPVNRPPNVRPPGQRPPSVRPPINRPPSMGRPSQLPARSRPASRPSRGRR